MTILYDVPSYASKFGYYYVQQYNTRIDHYFDEPHRREQLIQCLPNPNSNTSVVLLESLFQLMFMISKPNDFIITPFEHTIINEDIKLPMRYEVIDLTISELFKLLQSRFPDYEFDENRYSDYITNCIRMIRNQYINEHTINPVIYLYIVQYMCMFYISVSDNGYFNKNVIMNTIEAVIEHESYLKQLLKNYYRFMRMFNIHTLYINYDVGISRVSNECFKYKCNVDNIAVHSIIPIVINDNTIIIYARDNNYSAALRKLLMYQETLRKHNGDNEHKEYRLIGIDLLYNHWYDFYDIENEYQKLLK